MVIPKIGEELWLPRITGLPQWLPDIHHALIVSPHPDDETLGAGGLISSLRGRGAQVSVVAVTDGEHAYEDMPDLGPARQAEQTLALSRLGVGVDSIHRLRLPDSGLGKVEDELASALTGLISEGMHIVAPWPNDFHPDHEACGRAALAIAKLKRVPISFYFFWTWHRGELGTLDGLQLTSLPLSDRDRTAKLDALSCHRSQLEHADGCPILPEYLLAPVHRPFEVFLHS